EESFACSNGSTSKSILDNSTELADADVSAYMLSSDYYHQVISGTTECLMSLNTGNNLKTRQSVSLSPKDLFLDSSEVTDSSLTEKHSFTRAYNCSQSLGQPELNSLSDLFDNSSVD